MVGAADHTNTARHYHAGDRRIVIEHSEHCGAVLIQAVVIVVGQRISVRDIDDEHSSVTERWHWHTHIADLVDQRIETNEARVRRVRDGAVAVHHYGTAVRRNDDGDAAQIDGGHIGGVVVVGANVGGEGHARQGVVQIAQRDGWVVHRIHSDEHRSAFAKTIRVAHLVGEAHEAIVVRVRCVAESAVGIEHQGAVLRGRSTVHQGPHQRIVQIVDVVVVPGHIEVERRAVFQQGVSLIEGRRRIVDR